MPDQRTYCPHGVNSFNECAQCVLEGVRRAASNPAVPEPGFPPSRQPSRPMTATQQVMEDLNRRVINERLRAPAVSLRDLARAAGLTEERASVSYRFDYGRLASQPFPAQEQWGEWLAAPSTGRQPTTSRSEAMPVYPPSRDPNVPGDGRPLQVGDRVVHVRGSPAMVGRVIAVRGTEVQITRDGPSTVFDEHRMRGTGMGHWVNSDFALIERPIVQPVLRPASLDPAVPGDGRPLQRGDILRHVHDPEDGSTDCQLVSLFGADRLMLRPIGRRAAHFAAANGTWREMSFALVHRPTATEYHLQLPCGPEAGIDGAYVDPEFVSGICTWLDDVNGGRVMLDSILQNQTPAMQEYNDTRKLTYGDAIFYLRCFISATHDNPAPGADNFIRGGGCPVRGAGVEQNVKLLAYGLTNWLNQLDTSIVRCTACAATGVARPKGSPECQHYECSSCAAIRSGDPCAHCNELYIAELGYGRGAKICTSCCSHVACTEPGFEEIMLKQHQCATCKRGPKGCKCPGCEVRGCRAKPVRDCCGGCEAHCECGSMCMRHTGMKLLHHFRPPPDEKGMTRLLGTEIETYGSAINKYSPRLRKAVEAWKASVITDGSIGGKGVELVTQPAGGSMWRQMIADLGAGFKESQSVTRETCGLHMHADCTDVDGFALKRIIQLYHHIEFCLYDATTIQRQTGTYSRPNGAKLIKWLDHDAAKFDEKMAKGDAKRRLSYLQYGVVGPNTKIPKLGEPYVDSYGRKLVQTETSIEQLYSQWDETVQQHTRGKSNANRYSGLNMHSYWLRGTLEFRMFQGTNDPEKITNWGFVIGSIVDYCVKHTDEDMTMLLGLKPRLAMEMILEGQPDVMAWLQKRWDLFTTAHKTRKAEEPLRDRVTGEV